MNEVSRSAVTMSEAAQLMGVSRPTVYRWTHTAGFPVIRIGGVSRVLVDELREWVKQQAQEAER